MADNPMPNMTVLRVLRAGRITRLLRLAKLRKFVSLASDLIDSDWSLIIVTISQLLVMILAVNHVIAAGWYGVGRLGKDAGLRNWIDAEDMPNMSLFYRYSTSLHWSFCMFTPGGMSMIVSNSQERVYSVVVLIFGLIFSSSFIGSISAAINELKRMQGSKSKELWLFRRYLKQANISQKLYFRATQHANHAMEQKKSNLAVKDMLCWSLLMCSVSS